MPSSTSEHLHYTIKLIRKIQPTSVLDCGVGFGKWGFLCREYLDIYAGRVFPEDWKIRIEGIEVFEDYISKLIHLPFIYDKIYIEDMRKILPELLQKKKQFGLIIACDVIEHLPKKDALDCIKTMKELANHIILSVPIGEEWLNNKIVANNPAEKHQSSWDYCDWIKIFGDRFTTFVWKEAKGQGHVIYWHKK